MREKECKKPMHIKTNNTPLFALCLLFAGNITISPPSDVSGDIIMHFYLKVEV